MTKQLDKNSASTITSVLKETGIEADYFAIHRLDEASGLKVADTILADMFKFITDKYNSLNFREIEQSNGDYTKFKYRGMLDDNLVTLDKIYRSSGDDAAKKYIDIIRDIRVVTNWLIRRKNDISYLYKKRRGSIQMVYTSSVAAIVYTVAALVSNTIRYVTVDKDSDMEVLFDEIPSAYKNVHLKNVTAMANSIQDFDKFLNTLLNDTKKGLMEAASVGSIFNAGYKLAKAGGRNAVNALFPATDDKGKARHDMVYNTLSKAANSKVGKAAITAGVAVAAAVVAWKSATIIFGIIRSIIFTIYYSRIATAEAIEINATLLRANIEVLEARPGVKAKVIANQKKWLERLEKLALKFANNTDRGEVLANREIDRENKILDASNPERFTEDDYGNEILI